MTDEDRVTDSEGEALDPLVLYERGEWPDLDAPGTENASDEDGAVEDIDVDALFDDPGEVVPEEELQ